MLVVSLAVSSNPTPGGGCDVSQLSKSSCESVTPEIVDETVHLHGGGGVLGNNPAAPPASPNPPLTQPKPTANADPVASDPLQPAPLCSPEAYYDCFEVIEPVTLADLASFQPNPGTPHMEPTGWSVAGLPTNFWISTSSHIVDGELFGQPASVRFTPAAAHFNYGDGSPTVRTPLGGSWATSDADEFTPTSTSHTYAATGVYTISVGVDFTVEYSYDGSAWIPVEGTLVSSSPPLTAQIVRASTVLVSTDCTTDPEGIGC